VEQILYKRNEDVLMDFLEIFFGSFWRWFGTIILCLIVADIPASIIRAMKGERIEQLLKIVTGEKKNGN